MKVISTKDGAPMTTALSGLASEMGGRRRKEGSQAGNGIDHGKSTLAKGSRWDYTPLPF